MFKQNFVNICVERNVAPTTVLKEIGISHATFTSWTETSIPRQTTLTKIADYFGITPDVLLRDPEEESPVIVDTGYSSPLSAEFYDLVDQLTLKELREIQAIMEEKIKNRK